ncbi:MAG: hypothetical protein DHS20C17_07580 [Cyclobacteriaceae bacterium]|nr:MAG: hypothetical protein DHS20C17_07580 [Cyclobacteriaceae bacterium]
MVVKADYLYTKIWGVSLFKDDGLDKTALFNNVFIEFRPNFIFRITQGCETTDGEWILSSDSTLLVIRIPDNTEPLNQLSDEWVVTWLSDTEMRFIEQDNKGDEEFHLTVAPLNALSCKSCDHIDDFLIDKTWSVTSLISNVGDITDEIRGDYIEFKENGEVILHSTDYQIVGSWALTDQCRLLVLRWFQDQVYPDVYRHLEDSWVIGETDQPLITLENDAGTLELTEGIIPYCQDLHTNVLNTSWTIDFVSINQDDVSDNFTGTGLTLLDNNQLATEVMVGPAVLGTWILTGNCDRISFDIQAGQLKELSREWIIISVDEETITLVHEEGSLRMEMHLKKGAPQLSVECQEAIDHFTYGKWSIGKFTSNNSEDNTQYKAYSFKFKEDGTIVASDDTDEITGKWYPTGDCSQVVIYLDSNSSLSELSGKWEVEFYENGIIMVYEKMQVRRTVEMVRG